MIQLYRWQRVGIFVDTQNLYYSAKNLYGAKVDFRKVLEVGLNQRQLIRAIIYVIKADIPEEEGFFEALRNIGYEVKIKELRTYYDGTKRGDWDMGIAIDTIKMAEKLDTVVLVSGDGDFVALVDHLKAKGVNVEVMAFGKSTSSDLKRVVNEFIDLDMNYENFLIR
ncbi:MAG: NYN domain-containing protein [Theionarchaea archaeon]|nr:NYN domain-containing protein [Theionarchaea archaeon]MBU7001584.1 NYN domain-containing protein [Theionarchaea archaeon]MBU7021775.1 NYN domain-containing protein [Theionarchaea archaeon]MBU7040819.1 NYN domain-containing protein [Theionarchaea archaeon]